MKFCIQEGVQTADSLVTPGSPSAEGGFAVLGSVQQCVLLVAILCSAGSPPGQARGAAGSTLSVGATKAVCEGWLCSGRGGQ